MTELAAEPEVASPVVEAQVEVQAEVLPDKPLELMPVTLEQAAQQLIFDFREGWLPGIRVRAHLMGKDVHKFHTLEEWREVFVAWGGQGILK